MRAIILNYLHSDCVDSMLGIYEVVVQMGKLFDATVYTNNQRIQEIFQKLDAGDIELYPRVSFSLPLVTEQEIVCILEKLFGGIRIFAIGKYV
jgi:hypothetical protein